MVMRTLSLLLAASATALAVSSSVANKPPGASLSCVFPDGCGCSIKIAQSTCPGGQTHFFHELRDSSPLHFNLGHGDISASSTRVPTGMFTPAPGESWVETYRYTGGQVEIYYSPGVDTCTKIASDDGCEYFDVRAKVILLTPSGSTSYSGVGSCGC